MNHDKQPNTHGIDSKQKKKTQQPTAQDDSNESKKIHLDILHIYHMYNRENTLQYKPLNSHDIDRKRKKSRNKLSGDNNESKKKKNSQITYSRTAIMIRTTRAKLPQNKTIKTNDEVQSIPQQRVVVQDLYNTDPTQRTRAINRSCRLYGFHPRELELHHACIRYDIRNVSVLKNMSSYR